MDNLDKKPVQSVEHIEAGGEKIEEVPEERRFEARESVSEKLPPREAETKEILKEIEKIKLTPELRKEAGEEAVKIKDLDKEGKVSRLLSLAKEKGLSYAVNVAKQINDPWLLDTFHDAIVKGGTYKELPW